MRVDENLVAGFGVLHYDQADVGQLELHRVIQTHGDDFVPACKQRELPAPTRLADEIRNDEHDRAALDHRVRRCEQLGEIGFLAGRRGLHSLHSIEHVQHVTPAVARRDHFVSLMGVQNGADSIAVAREQTREHGDELGRQLALAHFARTEVDRARKIENEPGGDFAILLKLAHVRRLQARGDVPVDVAHVVVQLIFAQVREIESEATKERSIVALQQPVEPPQHGELESTQQ